MDDTHKHFVGEVAQKAIIYKDGAVLFVKNTGTEEWDFPGGRLHFDETAVEGLTREVREEVGLDIADIEPVYVETVQHPKWKNPRCFIFYKGQLLDESTPIQLQALEITEARWVPRAEIPQLHTWAPWHRALESFFIQKDIKGE